MKFFADVLKCPSSSPEESIILMQHYGGIFDHAVKIVTGLGLLVGLQILRLKHESILLDAIFWGLTVTFFFYLLRVIEHVIIFLADKADMDTFSARFRWSVGIISYGFNLLMVMKGYDVFNVFVKLNFLQGIG